MPQRVAVVHSDPKIMGGTPVFVGTRVPVQSFFDYLEGGDTLDEFLRQFPTVKREQVTAARRVRHSEKGAVTPLKTPITLQKTLVTSPRGGFCRRYTTVNAQKTAM